MVFGERLKKLRGKKMTQEQLGELMNVHSNTIFRWENGDSMPNTNKMSKLAEILGTSTAYLLGETDDPTPGVILIPKGLMNSTINVGDKNSISNNTSPTLKSFLPIPPMSYWGEVVDNARNLAKKGSHDDILGVSQMLKIALRLLEPALQIGEGATA